MVLKLLLTLGCAAILATAACGQAAVSQRPNGPGSSLVAQPAATAAAAATPAPPAPTPTPAPTPVPPTPTPAPPAPTIALGFGPGTVTVSVTGIANGSHEVHVHRDCTGNPNLHIVTLGTEFVGPDGTGSRTFSISSTLRGRGFDLLVYPLGASQGPPSLCAAV
jgi:hypothetical protein